VQAQAPAPEEKGAGDEFVIYGPGEGPRAKEKPDPNSPFSALHGMKVRPAHPFDPVALPLMHCPLPPCSLQSMWDLPGLNEKDMTREEFYKAVQVPTNVPLDPPAVALVASHSPVPFTSVTPHSLVPFTSVTPHSHAHSPPVARAGCTR